ncbi:MAG: hypothetical protein LBB58_05590, partial [Cellulomonadaceae bacterium]|nr:hypothetical protein [Cellulomonadaceae bacterium]
FIAFAKPAHPLKDNAGDGGAVTAGADVHELFLANFFAQSKALAFGKTPDEVRAEGTPDALVPARTFSGNRPSTSILAPELTPSVLGQLIALYEHLTFVQGIVWGIDSFDQWGVELGKKLALQVAPAVSGSEGALANQDPSTRMLVTKYRELREAASFPGGKDVELKAHSEVATVAEPKRRVGTRKAKAAPEAAS